MFNCLFYIDFREFQLLIEWSFQGPHETTFAEPKISDTSIRKRKKQNIHHFFTFSEYNVKGFTEHQTPNIIDTFIEKKRKGKNIWNWVPSPSWILDYDFNN